MDNLTDIELADLLGAPASDGDVQKRAATLAAALRKQQAAGQDQQAMAGLMGFFNAPAATAMGKAYGDIGTQQYEQAGKQLEGIPKVTEQRLQRALEAQRNEQQMAHQNRTAAESERSNLAGEGLKRQQLAQGKFGSIAPGGTVINQETGELGAISPVAQRPAGGGISINAGSVPGMEIVPGEHPTAKNADVMKVGIRARSAIKAAVDELRAIHKRVGTEMYGPDAERMQQLREGIVIEAKEAAKLGALSGPDMGIVTRLMGPDPTSGKAKLKALVGQDNIQANLDGMDKWLETAGSADMKAYGYRPKGGAKAEKKAALLKELEAIRGQMPGPGATK